MPALQLVNLCPEEDPQEPGLLGDENAAAVYLDTLAPGSRRAQAHALKVIAGLLGYPDAGAVPWGRLRYVHTTRVRAQLAARYAPVTANRMLAALRGTLHAACQLGQIGADDWARARDVRRVRGSSPPRGRALSGEELRALLGACAAQKTAAGVRDGALVAVLFAAGLRRAELVGLDVADVRAGELVVREGKGRKSRVVPLHNRAGQALAAWLRARGKAPGPLFLPVNRSGRIGAGRLSPDAVFRLLRRRAGQAGIPSCSPHDFRRTFVSALLDAGADLSLVQALAGHASPLTTARYDRRGEDARRRAVQGIAWPDAAG